MYYKHHYQKQLDYENEVPRMQKVVDRISAEIDDGRRTPDFLNELAHHKKILRKLQNRAVFHAKSAEYHSQLKRKYFYSTSHPWEAVSPTQAAS